MATTGAKWAAATREAVTVGVTWAMGKGRPATLSFVAELPATGTIAYRLRDDGQGEMGVSTLQTKTEGETLELTTALLGVRVPAPFEESYEPAVPASALAAPILAFRNGAGAITGRWTWARGGRPTCSKRRVKVGPRCRSQT